MTSPYLYFNGIDFETGEYLHPPVTPGEVARLAQSGSPSAENVVDAKSWLREGKRGLRSGDPRDLAQAGWGVVFAAGDPQAGAIREALRPLLDLRREQAGRVRQHYYRELRGERGVQPGDTKRQFLNRHGVGPGAADPERMPYYLLLVGDPQQIPYEFQYQLDMQYAVGRIWFDSVDGYARYARSVVAAETEPRRGERTAAFFAPRHPEDVGTRLSAHELASPLAERATRSAGWSVRTVLGDEATKARLGALLGGGETPDFLFTAGHGMVLRNGHPLQETVQGALLCRDWPGPAVWKGPMSRDFFFGGDDLVQSAAQNGGLHGMINFLFACYSAGVPAWDDFTTAKERAAAAPQPFLSHLPVRMLDAGALAVIGHIEKAWFCSIEWPGAGTHIQPFEDCLDRLLAGHPVGSAMEPFGQRYAELSSDLAAALEESRRGTPDEELQLAELWTNSHDARNYVVLGDPAARLPAAAAGGAA